MMIKLASKQTDEQKQFNNFARFHFIMAMMNLDLVSVKNLLKKEGKFLGWMNDWQFCNWLDKKFKSVSSDGMFHSRFKEQICLDVCPGADMLVFEYSKIEEEDSNKFFTENEDCRAPFQMGKTIRINLVLVFEEGKISDIRISGKGCDIKKIKKLQIEN